MLKKNNNNKILWLRLLFIINLYYSCAERHKLKFGIRFFFYY